jgi:hypothetical protein
MPGSEKKPKIKISIPPFFIYGIISAALLLGAVAVSYFLIDEGAFIILKGVIGDKYTLLNLIGVTAVICGVNILASWAVFYKDRVASHILGSLSVAVPVFIALKIVAILYL